MSTITLCYSPDCETISFAAAELERYLKAVNPAFAFSHASESSAANDCTIHLNTDLDPELSSGLDSRADDLFLISPFQWKRKHSGKQSAKRASWYVYISPQAWLPFSFAG